MSNAFSSGHQRCEGTDSGRLWTAHCQASDRSLERARQVLANPSVLLGTLHLTHPGPELPSTFPSVEAPRFDYGDRLRWVPHGNATDWGLVIGRFYSYAPHSCRWRWCYLIWLGSDSPSAAWVRADIAWEDDLERFDQEATR
jgi:hypothetical protein